MRLGQLNRRVVIERPDDSDGTAGGQVRVWKVVARAMVRAVPVGGSEALVAGTLHASTPWRIDMRFADVRVTDRLRGDWIAATKQIGIRSVEDPDGRRHRLVLLGETEPLEA